jgi:hypothetical protein
MKEKKSAGYFEAIFDILYLCTALVLGIIILAAAASTAKLLFGIMTLVLVSGDSFHLVPRIASILSGDEDRFRRALGFGKMITSIGMTVFYVLLWHIGILLFLPSGAAVLTGVIYALAALRIVLCIMPQNKWTEDTPLPGWNIYRNLPFFLVGAMAGILFLIYRDTSGPLSLMWLAVLLSFLFYIPVIFLSKRYPKLGMLMIPKTCAYVWIISMGLSLH